MPKPRFATRGVVLTVRDMETYDWPGLAARAGLTTLATHIFPQQIADFVATDTGRAFLARSHELGLDVEHELHAMSDLLPRSLFDRDPTMFRMDEGGARVREHNLCIHSQAALEVVCERALHYTRLLPSTTGRYFYWVDDGQPMCRCQECRALSDSDQALIVGNHVLAAIREADPRATLAHLAYHNTLPAPRAVKPDPGIFLEFAPISRTYDTPLRDPSGGGFGGGPLHAELLERLDENLEVFAPESAQALEYWLDESRFAGWDRARCGPIPWRQDVLEDDLDLYASRGIGHITSFAAWLDGEWVARFGEPPVVAYGSALGREE